MADTAEPTVPLRTPWLWTVSIVLADQAAKFLAVAYLKPSGYVPVIRGFFGLCYVENQGAAWGMLAGRQVFLIGFSVAMFALFLWKRQQIFGRLMGGGLILAVLAGGIIGNLIDRIRLGHVVDFLDFFWRHSHFPAFNIADSAICCATFALLLSHWHSDLTAKDSKATTEIEEWIGKNRDSECKAQRGKDAP